MTGGILTTIYAKLKKKADTRAVLDAYKKVFAKEPL